jgi:hypothetical protein
MERVGDRNRIIGFSCGNQFVITPLIAFKVLLIFLKLFIKHFDYLIDPSFKLIGFRIILEILFINS